MKTITIKLVKAGSRIGPFTLSDQFGNIIAQDVSKATLITGISYNVNDNVTLVTITSTGDCSIVKTVSVTTINPAQISSTPFVETNTACLWRHLTDINLYNNFYGKTEPYVIEYPFAYQYFDQILQNVKDYTKVYKYSVKEDNYNSIDYWCGTKIELDDEWFNKAIIYNGQQSSGILELVPKPKNNLKEYMKYPLFGTESKTITFTKSDNFYQFNTFYDIVEDKTKPLFITSCESLSVDKLINISNMDYGIRSFKKSPIRAKEVKIRYILDNRNDINLVSQFVLAIGQISYK